ncbi:MAG TPA: hypothetical protein VE398_19010 [Acidobacteriota bacterium]|nr:hypothetical protein [Acidobacteriota bacterium]
MALWAPNPGEACLKPPAGQELLDGTRMRRTFTEKVQIVHVNAAGYSALIR